MSDVIKDLREMMAATTGPSTWMPLLAALVRPCPGCALGVNPQDIDGTPCDFCHGTGEVTVFDRLEAAEQLAVQDYTNDGWNRWQALKEAWE